MTKWDATTPDEPIFRGGTDRGDKLCRCNRCGGVEVCSLFRDFYVIDGDPPDGLLYCEDCLPLEWADRRALADEGAG